MNTRKKESGALEAEASAFLVIVRDLADNTYSYGAFRAEDKDVAERLAIEERKADHHLTGASDVEAGFEVALSFDREELLCLLKEIE